MLLCTKWIQRFHFVAMQEAIEIIQQFLSSTESFPREHRTILENVITKLQDKQQFEKTEKRCVIFEGLDGM